MVREGGGNNRGTFGVGHGVCMVRGFVPGTCEKWDVVKNGGLGVGWFVGGERKQTHTDGEQTTKEVGGRRARER